MNVDDASLRLRDGRLLGYAAFGDPERAPVVALHGTPGCSASMRFLHAAAERLGVWVIAPNRPGYRGSTRRPGLRVTDLVPDLVELADALRLERPGLFGWSGGGPYALAAAALAPERFGAVTVAASVAPPETPNWVRGFAPLDQVAFRAARSAPWLLHASFRSFAIAARFQPRITQAAFRHALSASDRAASADVDGFTRGEILGAPFQPSTHGVVDDYRALMNPWGFALADVPRTVTVWQGSDDRFVAPWMARAIVDALPHAEYVECTGEGHLFVVPHAEAMLRSVMGDRRPTN